MKIARFWSVLRTEIFALIFLTWRCCQLIFKTVKNILCDTVMIMNSTQYYI